MTPAGPARAEREGGKGRGRVWVRPQQSEARPGCGPCGGGRGEAFHSPPAMIREDRRRPWPARRPGLAEGALGASARAKDRHPHGPRRRRRLGEGRQPRVEPDRRGRRASLHNDFVGYCRPVLDPAAILNERDARRARATLDRAERATSAAADLEKARSGLPSTVIERHRRAVSKVTSDLTASLARYERAKDGDISGLLDGAEREPGLALVAARIARGWSQKTLAERLGLREQQVQRYEADRYRSISLSNFRRVADELGVNFKAALGESPRIRLNVTPRAEPRADEVRRVLDHAKAHKWFDVPGSAEEAAAKLQAFLEESNRRLGSPLLLRTGIHAAHDNQELLLASWRARVIQRAEEEGRSIATGFDILDVSWLPTLAKLSAVPDGPARVGQFLAGKGIVFVYEPPIVGLRLDGAALIVDGRPVIALTLRHDRLDNFWFTLFHEVAHLLLHYGMGLSVGFYDDLDQVGDSEELEKEADDFASAVLIPPEAWRVSVARMAREAKPIELFAERIGVHPAIVFGRVRQERKNYTLFSDRVGQGRARCQFQGRSTGD